MQGTTSLARDEARRLLADFVPRAGREYARQRNFDRGPGDRRNVSMLSPYVRHRVLAESEVLSEILALHSPSEAFKSVQEVMWRTYWKGWLESHPSTWSSYRKDLDAAYGLLGEAPSARERYERATAGETGIPAFDAWVRELALLGYVHNHARMWFASIWIFTLELPWELGADFFMRHLLDGDPASNTLSWRWVAGRQTPGKTYLATRHNIARYTEGRLDPGPDLARSAPAPHGSTRPPLEPLQLPPEDERDREPALLILHDDDFGGATLPFESGEISAVAGLVLASLRTPNGVAPNVAAFTRSLAIEAIDSIVASGTSAPAGVVDVAHASEAARAVVAIARERGLARIVAPFGNVGPGRDAVDAIDAECSAQGLRFERIVRRYDRVTWPNAKSGFFVFGKRIPAMLAELGISKR